MSGIGAGGGLGAGGMAAGGLGMRGQLPGGVQGGMHGADQASPAGAGKASTQQAGEEFGRDGALARGQGFSTRDAFQEAAPKRAEAAQQEKKEQVQQAKQAEPALYGSLLDEELRAMLRQIRAWQEWLMQMLMIFKPTET